MGRRIKYKTEYERLEAIRRSKRLHINKKRKLKKLADLIYEIQLKNTKEYRDNLVEWNLDIGYDLFQTVTFIRFDNGMSKTKDAYYNIDYVAREVKKYIKSMFNTGNLKNAFWTFEQHEDLSWHSHLTLKFLNNSKLDRLKFSERMWTNGISKPEIIESDTDLSNILKYMLKDVKAEYTNKNALYWDYLSFDEYIEEVIPISYKRYLNNVLEEVEIEALEV